MTDKQEKFCQEYLIDLNATQAAIRAGYSQDTARQIGSSNLSKVDIQDKIQELRSKASEKAGIDLNWVLNRFKDISDRCMQAEAVMEWVDGEQVASGEYKFDSSGANKATEALGKHLGFFEKDNGQRQPVVAPTVNVYNQAPPLASSETEVQE